MRYFVKDEDDKNCKVTVEEVRQVFNEKYPGESNNAFGLIVRKAFPGIKRSRDSVSYYYSPLKWSSTNADKLPTDCSSQQGEKLVESSTQTLEPSPCKELLNNKLKEMENTNMKLKNTNERLKKQIAEVQLRNKKLLKERQVAATSTNYTRKAGEKYAKSTKKAILQEVNLTRQGDLGGKKRL